MRPKHYIVVVAVAVALRLAFVLVILRGTSWADVGHGSELGQIAVNLVEGRGFSSPFETGSAPTAWLCPAVPLLWAGIFRVFGVFSAASLVAVLVINALASAAACVVFARIADIIWRDAGGRDARWPLAVGLLLAVWPASVEMVRVAWYFTLQELVGAVLFLSVLQWCRVPRCRAACWMGLWGGLTALVNPVPLVLPAVAVPVVLWRARAQAATRLPQAAVALLIVIVCVSPWLIRNARVFGKPLMLRSSFAIELQQGNNVDEGVKQTGRSLHPALRPEEMARFKALGELGYAREAMRSTARFVREHPGLTLKRTIQRAYVYWLTDIFDMWPWQERAPWWRSGMRAAVIRVARIGVRVIPVLALLMACALGWLKRVPARWLFVLQFALLPLPYCITHVRPTYSYQVQPYLVLLIVLAAASRISHPRSHPPDPITH